ncbi:hypothetical protein [Kineosporia babensis]|uniref:Uncharacterized protein n=1 Tax=Kineosporia babensis TaxID=499548 RepID=A0A9X1NCS7_9ACTN|nr:hypothetical protein [Kineosporia babensis]MCD5311738.1 hypothetical protein [Kineosporia babensis]
MPVPDRPVGGVEGIPQQVARGAGWGLRSPGLVPRILDPWPGGETVEWVGRFRIDLLNGRGWPAPPAEIEVRRETVHLKHELVEVAVMPRRSFAVWLAEAAEVAVRPLAAGSVVWALDLGALLLTVGCARYRLTDESRRQVVLLV